MTREDPSLRSLAIETNREASFPTKADHSPPPLIQSSDKAVETSKMPPGSTQNPDIDRGEGRLGAGVRSQVLK